MSNYMIQNANRDTKPMNIKEVVLDDLRRYGIFIHLRDSGKIGYDLEAYLTSNEPYGTAHYKESIAKADKEMKECRKALKKLTTDGASLYEEYKEKRISNFYITKEQVKALGGKSVAYRDKLSRLDSRINALNTFLQEFKLDSELEATIKIDVQEMIEALQEDREYYVEQIAKEEESMARLLQTEEPVILSYEEWLKSEKSALNKKIRVHKEAKESAKKVIESQREKDAVIKKVFEALAPFDMEIE